MADVIKQLMEAGQWLATLPTTTVLGMVIAALVGERYYYDYRTQKTHKLIGESLAILLDREKREDR